MSPAEGKLHHQLGLPRCSEGSREVLPQDPDALTNEKAMCASIFKVVRDLVASDPTYQDMRKEWRSNE